MLHRYIVFQIELTCMRKWLSDIHHNTHRTSDQMLSGFLPEFMELPYWTFYRQLKLVRATKEEKILYLRFHAPVPKKRDGSEGNPLGINKIAAFLNASNKTVEHTIKAGRNRRHIQEHPGVDELIKEWQKYKKYIPDEIFVKYLRPPSKKELYKFMQEG